MQNQYMQNQKNDTPNQSVSLNFNRPKHIKMSKLKLIEPTIEFENEYNEMLNDWKQNGEKLVPFIIEYDAIDFQKFIEQMHGFKNGIGIPATFVPHSTFWLINSTHKILGVVNIRHRLTDQLLTEGGHIGYGIRPSERRKGYATQILKLALLEARQLGIERALVTCDKENIASGKTILNNGGKFDREHLHEGVIKQRYWID